MKSQGLSSPLARWPRSGRSPLGAAFAPKPLPGLRRRPASGGPLPVEAKGSPEGLQRRQPHHGNGEAAWQQLRRHREFTRQQPSYSGEPDSGSAAAAEKSSGYTIYPFTNERWGLAFDSSGIGPAARAAWRKRTKSFSSRQSQPQPGRANLHFSYRTAVRFLSLRFPPPDCGSFPSIHRIILFPSVGLRFISFHRIIFFSPSDGGFLRRIILFPSPGL
jgi:hypothetical protein